MKKLRLELDDLAVESFSTSRDARDARGTVQGQQIPVYSYRWDCADVSGGLAGCYTADGADTCQAVYTCPDCGSFRNTMEFCPETAKYCPDTVNFCIVPLE